MLYEYKCPECGQRQTSTERGDIMYVRGHQCGKVFKRVFAVNFAPVMQEHFNHALGGPISDSKAFARELRIKGEIATQETGIEHRYVPVDLTDKEAIGVDGRGIDESNRVREKLGAPLLPDIS